MFKKRQRNCQRAGQCRHLKRQLLDVETALPLHGHHGEHVVAVKTISISEYQPTEGQPYCLACPAGKTSSADHTQCVDCAAGTFAEEGFRVCEACAAGQISAAGASACVDPLVQPPCTAGEGWVDGNCVPCDEGKDQHLLQHYEPCYDSPCKYLDVLREGCGATQ